MFSCYFLNKERFNDVLQESPGKYWRFFQFSIGSLAQKSFQSVALAASSEFGSSIRNWAFLLIPACRAQLKLNALFRLSSTKIFSPYSRNWVHLLASTSSSSLFDQITRSPAFIYYLPKQTIYIYIHTEIHMHTPQHCSETSKFLQLSCVID